jgi:hypothetical protein
MSLSSRMSTEFWLKATKNTAIRNVRPISSVEICRRFGDTYCYSIQINHRPDATISPVYYPDVYLQLNMFRASWSGQLRPDHDQQHCYHRNPKVKPKAATAVVDLLMMGVRTPKNMLSCK